MTGSIQDLTITPIFGALAAILIGLLGYVGWRHHKEGRERRRYYREREQQRREYWGWDS